MDPGSPSQCPPRTAKLVLGLAPHSCSHRPQGTSDLSCSLDSLPPWSLLTLGCLQTGTSVLFCPDFFWCLRHGLTPSITHSSFSTTHLLAVALVCAAFHSWWLFPFFHYFLARLPVFPLLDCGELQIWGQLAHLLKCML